MVQSWVALVLVVFGASGLIATILIGRAGVHTWYRWSYGPTMPMVIGVAPLPIVQWLVLPTLTLRLARRFPEWSPGRALHHPSRSTEATS